MFNFLCIFIICIFGIASIGFLMWLSTYQAKKSLRVIDCHCGYDANLRAKKNEYHFGGMYLYWYECLYCGRKGEEAISRQIAHRRWKLKHFDPEDL